LKRGSCGWYRAPIRRISFGSGQDNGAGRAGAPKVDERDVAVEAEAGTRELERHAVARVVDQAIDVGRPGRFRVVGRAGMRNAARDDAGGVADLVVAGQPD